MENSEQYTSGIFHLWRVTVLTSRLIRLEFDPSQQFEDRMSQIVVNREFPYIPWSSEKMDSHISISTEAAEITLNPGEFDFKVKAPNTGTLWRYGEKLHNLGGTARTLDEADGAIPLENGIFSKEGIGILEDESSLIDGEQIICRRQGTKDLYLFLYGKDYETGLIDFYRLCGAVPLLPKFALGNWWSRYWAYSEKEYMALMDRFDRERVPIAVSVVDMDWHLTKVPEGCSGWTGYTWNRELFPDPKSFLQELHRRGKHITLNLHPAEGVQPFEEVYPKVAQDLGRSDGQTVPFDFTDPAFRKVYFEDILHPMEEQGVDFWWIDWQQGTTSKIPGVDPLWLLNHYQTEDMKKRKKTPLILSRYAGPGSHRYPVGFSGDTIVSWESLAFQPYFTSTAANIGFGWWSHDIGGHMNGIKDDELACRWVQFGVFSPINRLHSSCNPFAGKEPWNYRRESCEIMEEYLRLRHSLIPYLYSMNWRSHAEGIPIVRPLYHVWPSEAAAYVFPGEYVFGSEMLIAPITEACEPRSGLASTAVWLPSGVWYDFFTGVRYQGEKKITVYRPLSQIPVFVKAGSVIPMTDEDGLVLRIYPGNCDSFTVYDEKHQNAERPFYLNVSSDGEKIILAASEDFPFDRVKLQFCGTDLRNATIHANGKNEALSCYADDKVYGSYVIVPLDEKTVTIGVEQTGDMQRQIQQNTAEQILRYAQMELNTKDHIFREIKEHGRLPNPCKGLSKILKKALHEVLNP